MDGLTLDRHKVLPVLDFSELTEEEKKEYHPGYINEAEDAIFFRYLGYCYCLDDFMLSHDPDWDGYLSDTFFSGIFIKIDMERGEIEKIHAMRYFA